MPKFSEISSVRLEMCHPDIKTILNEVIKTVNISVICGFRGKEEQDTAYAMGRSKLKYPQSKHNHYPSMAVDVMPWPIDWEDRERISYVAGYVLGVADRLLKDGVISHRLVWGGDWDRDFEVKDNKFDDLVHFQLEVVNG